MHDLDVIRLDSVDHVADLMLIKVFFSNPQGACLLDMLTTEKHSQFPENCSLICSEIECAKQLLMTLFQMANLLLLLASIVDLALELRAQIYTFFLFPVIFRCLPLVDTYRKHISGDSALTS
ncbi:hypothetical protein HF086_008207 [Spodoptera exigua]|uniref:Uncharacterized protein n=1 Tax=Spodoptera exigua TaxID=7107 RepID=A0A922M545_SPOEX|nr:hypothetical protein HF086_008207 [Spodoptera exigua]